MVMIKDDRRIEDAEILEENHIPKRVLNYDP
jgi:hypothetical protein